MEYHGHGEQECPDLLTGANCSITWREALKPASEIVEGIIIFENALLIVLSFEMIIRLLGTVKGGNLSQIQREGATFRLKLLLCVIFFCIPILIAFCLGGMLEYQLTDIRGKSCIICLFISNCSISLGAGYLLVMYLSALNSQLRKSSTYIEKMDLRLLKKIVVPWHLGLVYGISACFVIADKVESPTYLIKVTSAIAMIFPILPLSVLHLYYFNKMANYLNEVTDSLMDEEIAKQLRKVAQRSRVISIYSILAGVSGTVVILFFAFTDYLHDEYMFFIYHSFCALVATNFFVGYIYILRTEKLNGSSRQQSKKKSKWLCFGTSKSITSPFKSSTELYHSNTNIGTPNFPAASKEQSHVSILEESL